MIASLADIADYLDSLAEHHLNSPPNNSHAHYTSEDNVEKLISVLDRAL